MSMTLPLSLIAFTGRIADRNPRGMAGAARLGDALSQRLGLPVNRIGDPQAPLQGNWRDELEAARPMLRQLAQASGQAFAQQRVPLIVMGRCASALATLPVAARQHPDVLVVWFDAHGDANVPTTSPTGYLGGMVLTGASGQWESGLGADLALANIVLVGARDLDPPEQALIAAGALRLVAPGPNLVAQLRDAIGLRPVYLHIDCDVLEPGIVPTEYRVPNGLSLENLRDCCSVLAQNPIIGIEIAEFESPWPDTGQPAATTPLLEALASLFNVSRQRPVS